MSSSPTNPPESPSSTLEFTLSPAYWLQQAAQKGPEYTVRHIMEPHTTPQDQIVAADDLLDMLQEISELTDAGIAYVCTDMVRQQLGSGATEADIERALCISTPEVNGNSHPITALYDGLVTGEDFLDHKVRLGVSGVLRPALEQVASQYSSRRGVSNELLAMCLVMRDLVDETVKCLYDFIESEDLWDGNKILGPFEPKEAYKHGVRAAIDRHLACEERKSGYRAEIAKYWGDNWEEEFKRYCAGYCSGQSG